MKIYPAIDLVGGQAVRLKQGDYAQKTTYFNDPLDAQKMFLDAGAEYLHVVDLDGAKSGSPENLRVIAALCENKQMKIEVGGGIRADDRVEDMLALGVDRVIIGTAAVKDPDFLARCLKKYGGERVVVGVDAKNGFVAINGWLTKTEKAMTEFCKELYDVGVQTVICTDISKDGLLSGTNMDMYRALNEIKGLKVTASGGVSYENEVEALRDMGLDAAIVGKAIYAGTLDLGRVIKIAKGEK